MFKLKIEKNEELTKQDLIEIGWVEKTTERIGYKDYFEYDNYILCSYRNVKKGPIIQIMAKDPTKISWMSNPEHFRISLPCPTKEILQLITNLIKTDEVLC